MTLMMIMTMINLLIHFSPLSSIHPGRFVPPCLDGGLVWRRASKQWAGCETQCAPCACLRHIMTNTRDDKYTIHTVTNTHNETQTKADTEQTNSWNQWQTGKRWDIYSASRVPLRQPQTSDDKYTWWQIHKMTSTHDDTGKYKHIEKTNAWKQW